jgi:hypothetical protein
VFAFGDIQNLGGNLFLLIEARASKQVG